MSFLMDNWILASVTLASGGLLAFEMFRGGRGDELSPQDAVQQINRHKAVVLDVCNPEEFAQGHIVGSRNVPLDQIKGHKQLPSKKDQPVVVVCQAGIRARKAASVLRAEGYTQVNVLAGGLRAWREAQFPVER
ncbi:MAG: rhodanese-like domain-containing protein [Burkholderiaceae bacterium]|nr:MAG: rhodanese-like domain-containing protein [Burkholderiaceae bacterium]